MKNVAILVALIVSSASVLTTCAEQRAVGALAIRAESSGIAIAVCEAIHADVIMVHERDSQKNRPWLQVWEYNQPTRVAVGEILNTNGFDHKVGPGETRNAPGLEPGNTVSVLLAKNRETPYLSVAAQFTVPESGLSGTRWLHPDQTTTDEPCPRTNHQNSPKP